tara:strand:- start:5739 stop:6650 length:912 start_codon:yes stop_codon:yes gene_type:complete
MATFNRAHLIGESLESISQQTFKNWECLIIDDGSNDETEDVVKSFTDLDSRFKYFIREGNHLKGLPGCRNAGLEKTKGEFVVFFDDDDIIHPKNLEICVSELIGDAIDFCRYERQIFTGNFNEKFDFSGTYTKQPLETIALEDIVMGKIPFNSCQVMWRRECFEKNKFNEKLMYAEEWECYLRILACGFSGITVNKVLFFGRKHPNSNTGEFWSNDPLRRESKVEATKLVIENLHKNDFLSHRLLRYFVQLGIFLKDKSIVIYSLENANARIIQRIKYHLLYELYPIIGTAHRIKKLLKKKLS